MTRSASYRVLKVPTWGRLEIAGRNITHLSANDLAGVRNEVIGFVFQSVDLVPRMSAWRK